MTFRLISFVSLGLVSCMAVTGCAPNDAPSVSTASANRPCFNVTQVRGFQERDRDSIIVETRMGQFYLVESLGLCLGLDSAVSVGIQADAPGLDRVCVGDYARLALADATPTRAPCRARVTQQLTADEAAALKK